MTPLGAPGPEKEVKMVTLIKTETILKEREGICCMTNGTVLKHIEDHST